MTTRAMQQCGRLIRDLPKAEPPYRTSLSPEPQPIVIPKTKKDVDEIINQIRTILTLEVEGSKLGAHLMRACEKLLSDPRFWKSPAAAYKHQAHLGGLAVHTLQVLQLSIAWANILVARAPDRLVLIYAALYHDAGKMIDYKEVDPKTNPKAVNGYWFTESHEMIGHLIASHRIMRENSIPWSATRQELAEHCVLSHHGQLEWGSPVTPARVEAWILHLSDMMSSRLDDPTEAKRGKK